MLHVISSNTTIFHMKVSKPLCKMWVQYINIVVGINSHVPDAVVNIFEIPNFHKNLFCNEMRMNKNILFF